mgnify:CR=1 FL=1
MIKYGQQSIDQSDIDSVVDILKSDWLTQGPTVPKFEESVASKVGAKFGVASNSATSALHTAYMSLGLKPGDSVWTSPNTFVATTNAAIFCGAIVGSCLGFLWYNAPPAKIFMGDTGSLSLGGSLAAIAIIVKHEIVLAIVGGLFVLEAISVIVQVISYKLTGKRIFRMAPIHHHFEKKGWPESTVVIRFWIISIILAMIGLATLKLR